MKKSLHSRATRAIADTTRRHNPLRGLTFPRLTQIFDAAREGRYAEIQNLNWYVDRRSPVVRAVKRRHRMALRKLDWDVKPVGEDLPVGATETDLESQKTFLLERYAAVDNMSEAIAHLASAVYKEYAHLEIHYDREGYPHHLAAPNQWHFWRDGIYGDWHYNPLAEYWPKRRDLVEIDPAHWITREVEDPAHEIFAAEFLRESNATKDWDAFIESYGIPWFFLVAPPCADAAKFAEYQAIADRVVGDGRGVVPHGTDVLSPDAASRGINPFTDYIKGVHSNIVMTATGGLLTMLTESGSGTLAGGAHQDAWDEIIGGEADEISEVFNRQLTIPLLELAFPGKPQLVEFRLELPDQDEASAAFIEGVHKLHSAGHRVSPDLVEEKTGWEIERPAPASAPQPSRTAPAAADPDAPSDPGASPADPDEPPLANRFAGGGQLAGDASEAAALAANVLADLIDARAEDLAPLAEPFRALVALARDGAATLDDFERLAVRIYESLPEYVGSPPVDELVAAYERGLGTAAAMGVRNGLRKRARTSKSENAKKRPS